jgi:hypothetical protein
MMFAANAASPHQVNRRIVRQPEKKASFIASATEQFGLPGELDKNFLKQIARVEFVAHEVQKKSEQRLGVVIVKPFKLRVRHWSTGMTRRAKEFV